MQINAAYHVTKEQMKDEFLQVESAKRDPGQFEPLYNKYHEPIFRFIYQRIDDKDFAFDLTSQVFLNALLHLKQFVSRDVPFSSWLYRIASNLLNDSFRKNKTCRTVNIETVHLYDMMEEMEEDTLSEGQEQMMKAIGNLEEDDLRLIEMRFFEKRPFKEIAEILDITENNAKVRIYRILKKIRKTIK